MQYLRNQRSDFKNSWSCLILTLLWIQRYTMYPLYLNYTTTLPCKAITMKIIILHHNACIEIKQKHENVIFQTVTACYQFKTLQKQFISRRVQSVRPKLSHKLEVFLQSSVRLCWWSSVADHPKSFARLSSACRWYLAWVEMDCSVQA